MEFSASPISFDFAGVRVRGDVTAGPGPARVLMLHGGGQSRAASYRSWREDLLDRGIPSAALDFIGHGLTGGEILGHSLEHRTGQALRFVEAAGLAQPLVIVASSMGAHTAIQLTRHLKVSGLLLNVPAVYDRAAHAVPFGPDFSRLIRRERSWEDSDAWEILRDFAGDLLVISASEDQVIPEGVIRGLLQNATAARSRRHLRLEGAGHRYCLEPERLREFFEAGAALVRAGLETMEENPHA